MTTRRRRDPDGAKIGEPLALKRRPCSDLDRSCRASRASLSRALTFSLPSCRFKTSTPPSPRWFSATSPRPPPAQVAAWPAIRAGRHTLVAAPTGSGKTLTAFLAALDGLVRHGLAPAGCPTRPRSSTSRR